VRAINAFRKGATPFCRPAKPWQAGRSRVVVFGDVIVGYIFELFFMHPLKAGKRIKPLEKEKNFQPIKYQKYVFLFICRVS